MSRSRSYFSSSARARRGKKGTAGEGEADADTEASAGEKRVAHNPNPTPFSYEVPPREPADWAAWDEHEPERVLDVRPSIHAPRPVAVRLLSERPSQPTSEMEGPSSAPSSAPSSTAEVAADSLESLVASARRDVGPVGPRSRARGPSSRMRALAAVAVLAAGAVLIGERTQLSHFVQSVQARARGNSPTPAQVAPKPEPMPVAPPPPVVVACSAEMALVERDELRVCVDKWEASLVEMAGAAVTPYSPYLSVEGHKVKAVSVASAVPQGYISRDEAEVACQNAGKRLCTTPEWKAACEGPKHTTYPYGDTLDEQACNIHGRSGISELFGDYGESVWDSRLMNDPSLNALEGTVARTGQFGKCTNGFGVYDMVGNLHEWTADKNGVFRGGYYHDAEQNGSGCNYATSAHLPSYHDYSTGFRCCADARQ